MKTVRLNKTDIIRLFANRVPDSINMAIDYGRDEVTIYLKPSGNMSLNYKASEIIKSAENRFKAQSINVIWN